MSRPSSGGLLCRLGFHRWEAHGGETMRDERGKIRVQWYVCARPHCQAMRAGNKSGA